MVGFFPCPVAKAQAVEDLQTAALQPVSLAAKDLCISLVHNPGLDSAVGHPRGSHQSIRQSSATCFQKLSGHVEIPTQQDQRR